VVRDANAAWTRDAAAFLQDLRVRRFLLAPLLGAIGAGLCSAFASNALIQRTPLLFPMCATFASLAITGYVGALVAWAVSAGSAFLLVPTAVGLHAFQDPVEVGRYAASTIVLIVMAGVVTWFRVDRRRLLSREHALLVSEERYRLVLEQAADAIFVLDTSGKLEIVNERFAEMLGYSREELLGSDITGHISSESLARRAFQPASMPGVPVELEDRELVRRDGGRVIVEVTSRRMADGRTQAIAREVTARRAHEQRMREMESRLEHSQRLEAIGRLAGTVAHDFNNFLTVVIGQAQLLEPELHTAQAKELANGIVQAGERAASLTRQLLTFSRKQEMRLEALVLDDVVQAFVPMLQALASPRARLVVIPGAPAAQVRADRTQLEQVLLNMVVNARDAIAESGHIEIRTGPARSVDEAVGPHLVLSVRDNGSGMDAATQARIFEPFFTTKPEGVGTGLGLATVFGIVRQSGGFLRVDSRLGQGSRFEVYLPDVSARLEALTEPASDAPIALLLARDSVVRQSLAAMLEAQPLQVIAAESPEKALALASSAQWTPALIVAEGAIDQREGSRVVDDLIARWPAVSVIRASSLMEDAQHPRIRAGGAEQHLLLPCRLEDLRAVLERALAAAQR
jgi:PAS domain S-box-containing protein